MKSFSLLLGFVMAGLISTAGAQVSPVRLRVEQSSKSDTTSYKNVQTRSLSIFLANSSAQPAEVKVKWAIFGRDIKSKEIVTVAQGETNASIKASGSEKVQTDAAHAVSEEARTGSKGKSEAVGCRMVGHGVQVWQADRLVAEFYDPLSLKESFGKAPPAQLPEKKKK